MKFVRYCWLKHIPRNKSTTKSKSFHIKLLKLIAEMLVVIVSLNYFLFCTEEMCSSLVVQL